MHEAIREARARRYSAMLLQEPYVESEGKIGIQSPITIQYKTAAEKPVKAAILILDEDLHISLHPDRSNENIAWVWIFRGSVTYTLISVYFEGTENLSAHLTQLQSALDQLGPYSTIIGGDFNARSLWWGDRLEDSRGTELAEFFLQNDLTLLNSGSIPTFQVYRGDASYESIVDITVCSPNLSDYIHLWTVDVDLITLSDHNAITFKMNTKREAKMPTILTTRKYNTKNADWAIFKENLRDRFLSMCLNSKRVA